MKIYDEYDVANLESCKYKKSMWQQVGTVRFIPHVARETYLQVYHSNSYSRAISW